ncbi:MAG: PRC-barrel domain-containing protein [Thermosynechococcus sp. Uc]|uniref:PRC-barrel domain-containing protein n=1 Tax=Thermosynechococcus sp. Uc TaxID=3034853 RepID=UPI001A02FA65|nr:PRC-barrel domain-containing protein [Thermosynechococcus sp. Uc]MDM7326015.1 PRC-barrel domain-containing protein [Thermosynechococcus sp. Uc]HIK24694.1 PRC-barrel domain-containing protein [Thermosynechococcus sp. M46_R2017_013]
MTISAQLLQRADLIGTQVITRDTGRKLGVINQVWVDPDQRQVVALGVRNTLFTGEQRYILLDSIRQIGDVILVEHDDDVTESLNTYNYSTLIDSEIITETGEVLGKVRGFKFDPETGDITNLILASIGLPWIPAQLISTYELPIEEIVSTGPDRIIVFEGAETRLRQLTVGLLERIGLGAPPWESDEDDYYQPVTPSSNQLPSGARSPVYPPQRSRSDYEADWEAAPRRRRRQPEYVEYPEEEYEYEERPRSRQVKPPAQAMPIELPESEPTADPWEEQQPIRLEQRQKQEEYDHE